MEIENVVGVDCVKIGMGPGIREVPANGHPVVGQAEHVPELHNLLLVQVGRGRAGDVRHVGRTGETINLGPGIGGVTT